jgi:hypothetical protein
MPGTLTNSRFHLFALFKEQLHFSPVKHFFMGSYQVRVLVIQSRLSKEKEEEDGMLFPYVWLRFFLIMGCQF